MERSGDYTVAGRNHLDQVSTGNLDRRNLARRETDKVGELLLPDRLFSQGYNLDSQRANSPDTG